jgi:two-component system response regulator AtoC
MSARVLVVLADSAQAETIQTTLAEWGYEPTCASDAGAAPTHCAGGMVDVVLWERNPVSRKARAQLRRLLPEAAWIEIAVPGIEAELEDSDPRVADVLRIPVEPEALRAALRRAERFRELERRNRLLRAEIELAVGDRPIVAASPSMVRVLEETERAASAHAPVLLVGERGTGREGLARAIHAQSPRRRGPFVAVRAQAGLAGERELFGTVEANAPMRRGPIASADGGTLYLEQIDVLGPAAQARLLELLATGSVQAVGGEKTFQVDVRLIVASNRALDADVAAGRFEPALLDQLSSIRIPVPPLRERKEDIPLLVDHFFARAAREAPHPLRGLADDALARLTAYDWPGNVRELEAVIERSVLLASSETIAANDLVADLERAEPEASPHGDLGLRRARRRAEIEIIRRALRQTGGNRTHAAKLLEISHRALLYKLKEYGLKS